MPDTVLPPGLCSEKQLRKKLAELERKSHLPHDMLAVVAEVAVLQIAALPRVSLPEKPGFACRDGKTTSSVSADARAQGAFMLAREEFPLDMGIAERLVAEITDAVAGQAPHLAAATSALRAFLEEAESALPHIAEECLRFFPGAASLQKTTADNTADASEAQRLALWKQRHPEAPELLRFVVQSALMPSLMTAGRLLGRAHNADVPWKHGHCPVCGSLPYIGTLRGAEGVRMHVCSFCAFEFRVPRIGCPFCLDESPQAGEYFAAEEEPGFRLEVCRSCTTYIKVADFREMDRVWLPQLDDLASITLDLYARQMGFARPTLSAWGF